MSCAEEKVVVRLDKRSDITIFCDSWRTNLGEKGYLCSYNQNCDLEHNFRYKEGVYVFEIKDYPLFRKWEGGDQIRRFVLGFIKSHPEISIGLEYVAVDDVCSEALVDTYSYASGKLYVRQSYSEFELSFVDGKWNNPDGFNVQEEKDQDAEKYMTDLVRSEITNAWKYEDELDALGYLPDEDHGKLAWDKLPRVRSKAIEGDEKAISILDDFENIGRLF